MLTHRVTKQVDLPHEAGAWIEVRLPSLAILDRARRARIRKAVGTFADIDVAYLRNLATSERDDETAESRYDWQALLQECVIAWSYEEPVTPDNIAELDEATVNVVVAELVPRQTELDRKNVLGGSTTP